MHSANEAYENDLDAEVFIHKHKGSAMSLPSTDEANSLR